MTSGDYMPEEKELCLSCVMRPCMCMMVYLDIKLESLKEGKKEQKRLTKCKKRQRSKEEEMDAGP